jgi:hypothetical protein
MAGTTIRLFSAKDGEKRREFVQTLIAIAMEPDSNIEKIVVQSPNEERIVYPI